MLIFVRIETHAVIFSGISVRIVDLASEAFWSHFVRIGTRHFDQNLAKSVRIGTRIPWECHGSYSNALKGPNLVLLNTGLTPFDRWTVAIDGVWFRNRFGDIKINK